MSRQMKIHDAVFDDAVTVTPDSVTIRCKDVTDKDRPVNLKLTDDELIELIKVLDQAMVHRRSMRTNTMTILAGWN